MTHQIVAMNRMAIAEEIEQYAEKNGASVFYTVIDNTPMAILSNTDIHTNDTVSVLQMGMWQTRIFRPVDPNVTRGQLFVVYQLNDM